MGGCGEHIHESASSCMIIFSGNALLQLTNGLHVYFGFMMGVGSLGLNESGDDGDT